MPAHKSHVTRWLSLEGFKRAKITTKIATGGFDTQQMDDYVKVSFFIQGADPIPEGVTSLDHRSNKLGEMAAFLRTKGYTVSRVNGYLEVRKPA